MAKKQTRSIGVARKRCVGKKGTKLKNCMRRVMKGGKTGVKKKRKGKVGRPRKRR